MSDVVVALNAGSSSLKFALYRCLSDAPELLARGQIDGIGAAPRFTVRDAVGGPAQSKELAAEMSEHQLLEVVLEWIENHTAGLTLRAAGHRVVHGGAEFSRPVWLDGAVLARLEKLVPLAPLHQPHNLAAIRALAALAPGLPQIACFDTAFHHHQPALATIFALPREIRDAGVRRYGFHGLSYDYIAHILPGHVGDLAAGRVVVAHLGHGASMCALSGGKSVATTMGMTALDGLPMGTRCGALDPGVLLYLMAEKDMDCAALTQLLYHRSGLLGLSGLSDDMRELLASDAPESRQAIALFCYQAARHLGSLAAALGGLDLVVFTGGIGEHAAPVRADICRRARWLGVALDEAANRQNRLTISTPDSRVPVLVIPTDENLMIVRHVLDVLDETAKEKTYGANG